MAREALGELLAAGRLERVGEVAAGNPGILGRLVPRTYDPDPLIGWRAVEGMGIAAPVDTQIRGTAVWCVRRLCRIDVLANRPALLDDDGAVDLYDGGVLTRTSVRRLAHHALDA